MIAGEKTPDTEGQEFVITRVFDAPREIVFEAWTEPRQVARWWGPKDFTNPVCEMDVRPGGAYRIVMRGPDGVDYPNTGVYREVAPPERLVMTDNCVDHPQEWHNSLRESLPEEERDTPLEGVSTVTFEEVGDQTRVTVRTRFASPAVRDAFLKMGMSEGWSQSLDRLEEHLAAARA